MKTKPALLAAVAAGMLLLAAPSWAHHSFAAEFDAQKTITLQGTVTSIDWRNPHFYFTIDVKDENGQTVAWRFEGFPPNMLVRQGWTKNTLKVGDHITVMGFVSKSDPHLAGAREVTFPDGVKRVAGLGAQ